MPVCKYIKSKTHYQILEEDKRVSECICSASIQFYREGVLTVWKLGWLRSEFETTKGLVHFSNGKKTCYPEQFDLLFRKELIYWKINEYILAISTYIHFRISRLVWFIKYANEGLKSINQFRKRNRFSVFIKSIILFQI